MQLTIGDTVIAYRVRPSAKARRMRLVVTPDGVELVRPADAAPDAVEAFVHRKRRWLFDAVREMDERRRVALAQQYASGARFQFRGRWLQLDVRPAEVPEVEIALRSRFHVDVPAGLGELERLEAVRDAFGHWLRGRALDDVERIGRAYCERLGVEAAGFRLSDARRLWGSCGKDRVVRVHWMLAQAPVAALEYVVAHEVAHLIVRNHRPAFWATIGRVLPDWDDRKRLLERWETEHRVL